MKQIFTQRALNSLLLLSSFFLFSCASVTRFSHDTYAARDAERKSFVQKTDGTVIEADEARLRMPLFGKSTITLDGDLKIPTKEITAYQNSTAYYRKIESQFAPRIKKGPINMYSTTRTSTEFEPAMGPGGMSHTRTRTVIIYHLQKGDSAATERYSPKVTRRYVQDYAPAMEFINAYDANKKKYRIWSYVNTAATLGGLVLMSSKGLDKNDNVTTAAYVSAGLFFGGLVNGFVNKIHKARNYKNIEIAIDTYNGQVIKKKRKR